MPKSYHELIQGNEHFVEAITKEDPDFFHELAKGQHPKFLWIGCADSRVPPSKITQTQPGSMFVHRNIANMVIHTDANMLSVAYYAIKVLGVKHVIVCGHYGCGGVSAAMHHKRYGYIDGWLAHIKDVIRLHRSELDALPEDRSRFDRLVELNVVEQVNNLAKVPFVQEEWAKGQFPYIHGWVYDIETGSLKDLNCSVNNANLVDEEFHYEL